MKRLFFTFISSAALLALASSPVPAVTVADYAAGDFAGGIANTRHNLGAFGPVITTTVDGGTSARGTTEICVFCHTPHHSNKGGANGLAPLWNRGNATTSFTAYGTTIGGTVITSADIGGSTLACLSCHDGVTTFDNIVNAPGKGGLTNGGADQSWLFTMPSEFVMPHTAMDSFGSAACSACHTGDDKAANVNRFIVGTDLSNDHPVSVPYNPSVASLRSTATVLDSIDLTEGLDPDAVTYREGNLAQNRWAVSGFISDTATISDLLRNGKVECSSCHDPHFDNKSWDEVDITWADGYKTQWCGDDGEACSDGNFLRRVGGNTGSGVCRTCHDK